MAVPAVLFAIVTVLVGGVALGDVMGDTGPGQKRLAATHVVIAATGVAVLLVALVDASRATVWMAFAALVLAGGLGLATLSANRRPRHRPGRRKGRGPRRRGLGHLDTAEATGLHR